MPFMSWIIQRLNDASDFFYEIYREVMDWVYPFWLVADFFYELSWLFWRLAQDFYDFNELLDSWAIKIGQILSYANIWSYFEWWFDRAEWAWSWVADAFSNVWDIADSWWSSTQDTVLAWIEEVKSYAESLVDEVNAWLAYLDSWVVEFRNRLPRIDEIDSWWRNWTGEVLSVVDTWWTSTMGEVQGLIDSAFIVREPFWAGWQDFRDQVAEFFSDPEDWLYKALDRIVERFW